LLNRKKPPKKRPGFSWEWRDGCRCVWCFWKGSCSGETRPHWIEVRETELKD